jgi:UDP-2,3-diacylglucosamine pyrophosphatase LpxH
MTGLIQLSTKITEIKHRALFISDAHIGSNQSKAERLYKFLCINTADTIYLVGDIIETNGLDKWPLFHDMVLKILCQRLSEGTQIVFVPGNHDSVFRHHIGQYGNLKILNHAYHTRANGQMLLVIHGDETDMIRFDLLLLLITKFEKYSKIHLWEVLRRLFTSCIEKHTLEYENKIIQLTRSLNFSAVVCGHIHKAKISEKEGITYLNTGDWVTNCTAIAEDKNGEFTLLQG